MDERDGQSAAPPRRRPAGVVLAAIVAWFGLWTLTPGLLSTGVGSLVSGDQDVALLIETILALAVVLVLMLLHRPATSELFARSWTVGLYALPIIAGITLPFHFSMPVPLALYMFWMIVSVFWQDYLTFGLLQKYLADRLPSWAVLAVSSVIFWAGHALLLPGTFSPEHWRPSLAILALGAVMASLRLWSGTLHPLLALHLAFYFIAA